MFTVRKLMHEDYMDICDISKDIWEGLDYLPELFHSWVEDKGLFLGAVDASRNKVVGVAKLSILADGSGWLEGLRVHSAYRGQKLAKMLTEILLKDAKEKLGNGAINKIAFSTHLLSAESRNMMEKLNFSVVEAQTLVLKDISMVPGNFSARDFSVEPWAVSLTDLKNTTYLKKRKFLLPLAFLFQELTEELYEELREQNALIKINGHCGIFKFKGEPNFLAFEDTYESIDTFMNYYLLSYKDKGINEIYTPILSEDISLINKLKAVGYYSWTNWTPDYLYYIYNNGS